MRTDRLVPLLAAWLAGGGTSYVALASGLRALALDGRLPIGSRLPSERALAAALGLSRTTTSAAYDVLRAEGHLVSAHGAGSRVAAPRTAPARPDAEAGEPEQVWDLTVAALPAPSQLLEAVGAATAALPPLLAGHGLHPYGVPALRAAVARHLSGRGLATDAEQVLVTSGALLGWNLVLRALTRPGQGVLVEQPTYPAVLDAAAAHHLRPRALPVHASGWELPGRSSATGPAPVVAHVTPEGQNPTGHTAGTPERRALLASLATPWVVADETFADLVLEGPVPEPMAALDPRVITLGSMSKAHWAGLRVGWLRAEDPALLARLAQARNGLDLTSPVLEQLVAAELLHRSPAVLAERRAVLLRGRAAVLDALARWAPDWECAAPRAGMALWVGLPSGSASRTAAAALTLGVRVGAGPRFTVDGTADRWLRLPFTLPVDRADEAVRLLREAHRAGGGTARQTHRPPQWTA